MVAMPPVMMQRSSDRVMAGRYGLISSGASVWPRKMLAEALRLSGPDSFIVRAITHAKT